MSLYYTLYFYGDEVEIAIYSDQMIHERFSAIALDYSDDYSQVISIYKSNIRRPNYYGPIKFWQPNLVKAIDSIWNEYKDLL
jgi:hypothetical protein